MQNPQRWVLICKQRRAMLQGSAASLSALTRICRVSPRVDEQKVWRSITEALLHLSGEQQGKTNTKPASTVSTRPDSPGLFTLPWSRMRSRRAQHSCWKMHKAARQTRFNPFRSCTGKSSRGGFVFEASQHSGNRHTGKE